MIHDIEESSKYLEENIEAIGQLIDEEENADDN